jgi:hypothetical protein
VGLVVVVTATLGWTAWGRRRGIQRGYGLLGHAPWEALVATSAVALLGSGTARTAGLVGMGLAIGWLLLHERRRAEAVVPFDAEPTLLAGLAGAAAPAGTTAPEGTVAPGPRTAPGPGPAARDAAAPPAAGLFGRPSWLVDFVVCERCGGLLVGTGRVDPGDHGPHAGGPQRPVAQARCTGCGLQLIGMADPARPGAGIVWFELPEAWPESSWPESSWPSPAGGRARSG